MEERIKDLKNKNIKIRRVKKNEMAESVVLLKEDIDRPSFAYSQVERVPSVAQSVIVQAPEFRPSPMKQGRKQENAMFYSTAHDLQGRGEDMGRQITENVNNFRGGQSGINNMKSSIMSTFAAVDMRASNYDTETKNKILVEDPRRKNKRENPLFYSTNQQVAPVNEFLKPTGKPDGFMEVYALGKTSNSVLQKEESRLKEVAALVDKEKRRVDQDLDTMVQTVISMFDQTRAELHGQMDDYLTTYVKNYENFKNRVKHFRAFDREQKKKSDVAGIPVVINKIEYFGKDPSDYEQLNKYKEEKCKISCQADQVAREVEKRLLTHLANEIEKQGRHVPLYNHSSSSGELLGELREGICEGVADRLAQFQHLLFVSPYSDLATYVAQANIDHLVANDGHSAMGTQRSYSLDSSTPVALQPVGTQCTSLLPLGDDLLAVATEEGSIRVYSRKQPGKEPQVMGGHHQGAINTMSMIRLSASDLQGHTAVMDMLTNTQHKGEQTYLVTGGLMDRRVIVWDLGTLQATKIFQGHSAAITCLVSMRDRKHLASSSADGSWCLWDVTATSKPRVCRYTDNGGPVNCLSLSKNKHFLFSASEDCSIKVYTNDYDFQIAEQGQVLADSLLALTLQDTCPVHTLSVSSLCDHTLFSAGQDLVIKQWDVNSQAVTRRITGHSGPVRQMVLFENPFHTSSDKASNFILLSLGHNEEHLRLSTPGADQNTLVPVRLPLASPGMTSSPLLALVQGASSMTLLALSKSTESTFQCVSMSI